MLKIQFSRVFFTSILLISSAVALPSERLEERALCKKPHCTSYCPDGIPFDCCVDYIRDPCSDHQLPDPTTTAPPTPSCTSKKDFDCLCQCSNDPSITYLCNAEYFRDPCEKLPLQSAM